MSEQAVKVAGLIVLARRDAAAAMRVIGGGRVIEHVIERMRKVKGVAEVVVVTDGDGDAADGALDAADAAGATNAALSVVLDAGVRVVRTARVMMLGAGRVARAWSGTTWRGGIGGATVYDEVIDAKALVEVMQEPAFEKRGLRSALIVGATWPLLDSELCGRLIERHGENPAEFKLVFTQSPPGLAGVVVTAELLEQMANDGSNIGHLLDYNPTHPQGDPIARDICVQIGPELRQAKVRAIAGSRRWEVLMQAAFEQGVGDDSERAAIGMAKRLEERGHEQPVMVTVELTTRRPPPPEVETKGLLRIAADRADMTLERAKTLFAELGEIDDVAVMFGGVGDPLCHGQWAEMVRMARAAGIGAIAVDTDLNVDAQTVERLIESGVDVVKVRLNADSKQMYERMMGTDAFERVGANVQRLLQHRLTGEKDKPLWVVPTMVKTRENVTELESFVDRWSYFAGAVLVEGPGECFRGQAVIDMAPPRRFACRQLTGRLTVLSDGRIARCDQAPGSFECESVREGWKRIEALRVAQREGKYEGICETCGQWHRP